MTNNHRDAALFSMLEEMAQREQQPATPFTFWRGVGYALLFWALFAGVVVGFAL